MLLLVDNVDTLVILKNQEKQITYALKKVYCLLLPHASILLWMRQKGWSTHPEAMQASARHSNAFLLTMIIFLKQDLGLCRMCLCPVKCLSPTDTYFSSRNTQFRPLCVALPNLRSHTIMICVVPSSITVVLATDYFDLMPGKIMIDLSFFKSS